MKKKNVLDARASLKRGGVGLIAALVATFLLIGASAKYQKSKICKSVDIYIDAPADNHFFTKSAAQNLLKVESEILGAPLNEITLASLENQLLATRYVKNARAYFTGDGGLKIEVVLRKPIARLYNERNHKSFYLDETGYLIPPTSAHSARTLLVSGVFADSLFRTDSLKDSLLISLLPLLNYVDKNRFWHAQISEAYIDDKNELTLGTQIGDSKILFGDGQNYETKLRRLMKFYREVIHKVGWNYYQTINLKYQNQIIGVKRKAVSNASGSASIHLIQ